MSNDWRATARGKNRVAMQSYPRLDTRVELATDAFGYPAGSRGTVVRRFHSDEDGAFVRFDVTGHTLLIPLVDLAPVSDGRGEQPDEDRQTSTGG